jgi:hypothetical protein
MNLRQSRSLCSSLQPDKLTLAAIMGKVGTLANSQQGLADGWYPKAERFCMISISHDLARFASHGFSDTVNLFSLSA